jgi:hypothetical protein
VNSSQRFRSTNQYHQIQHATHCLSYLKIPEFTLKMATAMFAEKLDNTQHWTLLKPKSRSYTLNSRRGNYGQTYTASKPKTTDQIFGALKTPNLKRKLKNLYSHSFKTHSMMTRSEVCVTCNCAEGTCRCDVMLFIAPLSGLELVSPENPTMALIALR